MKKHLKPTEKPAAEFCGWSNDKFENEEEQTNKKNVRETVDNFKYYKKKRVIILMMIGCETVFRCYAISIHAIWKKKIRNTEKKSRNQRKEKTNEKKKKTREWMRKQRTKKKRYFRKGFRMQVVRRSA